MSSVSAVAVSPSKKRHSSHSSNEFEPSLSRSESNALKRRQPENNTQGRSEVIVKGPRKNVRVYSHHNDYAGLNSAGDTSELCVFFSFGKEHAQCFVSMFQHGSRIHQNTHQCRVGRTFIPLIDLSNRYRHRKLWLQIFQNLDARYIQPVPRKKQRRCVSLESLESKSMAASIAMNRTLQVILVIEER